MYSDDEEYGWIYDDKKPENPSLRNFLKAIVAGGVVVGTAAAIPNISFVQREVVYKTTTDLEGKPLPPIKQPNEYGLEGVISEKLETKSGDSFLAWRSNELQADKKTLVLFPSNGGHLGASPTKDFEGNELGGNGTAYVDIIKEAQQNGYQVVAVNHVGYAGSSIEGSPTQAKMYEGAEAVIDKLIGDGIKPKDLHITGVSMGTAIAAHAANHLSTKSVFKDDDKQKINLTMVNGLVSVRAGLEDKFPILDKAVLKVWDDLDSWKELQKLASNAGKLGNVAFVRGNEDPLTPENQVKAHHIASHGMNFRSETVDAVHFVKPNDIIRQFAKMEKGEFAAELIPVADKRGIRSL